MRKRSGYFRLLCTLFLSPLLYFSFCQENDIKINTDWDHERHAWASSWITHPTASLTEYGVFNLRNTFQLSSLPDSMIVYVSADNRYRLLVNQKEVSRGPARGSLMHWRYETIDIAPFLKKGENLIAAEVYNLGFLRPAAQHSYQTAFIFQSDSIESQVLNTPGTWRISKNRAWSPIEVTPEMVKGYYVAGPTERIDGSLYPWDWETKDFDDSAWESPRVITKGVGRGYMHGVPWMLVPRNIPMMETFREYFQEVRRSEGISVNQAFINGAEKLEIPPRTSCKILLDQAHLTTTFPALSLSGGKGAALKLSYAESLYHEEGSGKLKTLYKGNRDQVEGKKMLGYYDLILPDGKTDRKYQTLTSRTYRYLELAITTGDQPLTINHLSGLYSSYPFQKNATFVANDPFLDTLQEIGWRTARLCAAETYMDCPYYEQLQYLGDTRIQSLISLYISGDDRLMRNALQQADHSRLPDGLTLSRAPSAIPQIIPAFSLYWVDMVHDYFLHRQDDAFVESFLPGIEAVLGWFERRLRDDGLLGGLEWLNFADWTEGFMVGSPPGVDLGGSALVTLNYAYALDRAAELFEYFGDLSQAEEYAARSRQIKEAVYDLCYDTQRGLLADTPAKQSYSQHTNIFGILCSCFPASSQSRVMEQILRDSSLVQTTIYFRFYLFEALEKAGLGDRYLSLLEPWKEMVNKGLSTWEEGDYEERSDCHAWGSSPNYHLLSLVCGIRPDSPGFKKIKISPNLGELEALSASMPHPDGTIRTTYRHKPGKKLTAAIELPKGTSGTFHWGGQVKKLTPGKQTLHLKRSD